MHLILQCNRCDRGFALATWAEHVRQCSMQEIKFKCKHCKFQCLDELEIKQHIQVSTLIWENINKE